MNADDLRRELHENKNINSVFLSFIKNCALDSIWYKDLEENKYEWISPKFWESLGYLPSKKDGLIFEREEVMFPEDYDKIMVVNKKNTDKNCHEFEHVIRYRHKNSSTVWMKCKGTIIRDKNNKPIRILGSNIDITDLKNKEIELSKLKNEYESVFNGTADAMFLIKVVGPFKFEYVRNNLSHQIKTKFSEEDIAKKTPEELLGTEEGEKISKNYQECINTKKSISYEETLVLNNDKRIWLTTLTPVFEDDSIKYIVGSATDITERKKLEEELKGIANYDYLTGVANRRLFFDRLNQLIKESDRNPKNFAVLFIDLDGFKLINDQLGHETGDKVLRNISNRIQENIRKYDTIARMGGDEFAIILNNLEKTSHIDNFAKKICKIIKMDMEINNQICSVDSSIGVAIFPTHGKESKELIKKADMAMYEVKKNGKGGYKIFDKKQETF